MSSLIVKPCNSSNECEGNNFSDSLLSRTLGDSLDDSVNLLWRGNFECITNLSSDAQILFLDSSYLPASTESSPQLQWCQSGDPYFDSSSFTLNSPTQSTLLSSNVSLGTAFDRFSSLQRIHRDVYCLDHEAPSCCDDIVLASPLKDLSWNPVLSRVTETTCSTLKNDNKEDVLKSAEVESTLSCSTPEYIPSCEAKQRRVAPSCFRRPKTSSQGVSFLDQSMAPLPGFLETSLDGGQGCLPRVVPILTPPTTINSMRHCSEDCKVHGCISQSDLLSQANLVAEDLSRLHYLDSLDNADFYGPASVTTHKAVCLPPQVGHKLPHVQPIFSDDSPLPSTTHASPLVVLSRPPEGEQEPRDQIMLQDSIEVPNKTLCLDQSITSLKVNPGSNENYSPFQDFSQKKIVSSIPLDWGSCTSVQLESHLEFLPFTPQPTRTRLTPTTTVTGSRESSSSSPTSLLTCPPTNTPVSLNTITCGDSHFTPLDYNKSLKYG